MKSELFVDFKHTKAYSLLLYLIVYNF